MTSSATNLVIRHELMHHDVHLLGGIFEALLLDEEITHAGKLVGLKGQLGICR